MSAVCSKIVWLCGLLAELGFFQSDSTLHADNISAIQIATNLVYHKRMKHIEVDCHSIREALDTRVISLPHVSTDLQIVDVFTKVMTRQRHQFLVGKLMLLDRPTSICGGCQSDTAYIYFVYLAIISFFSYGMFLYSIL
jgi:hypothetical protein